MAIEVKLPSLGEGIESGDVLDVLVREGDLIRKDQGVIELETDKATVEVPSSHAGQVSKIHVKAGDKVPIGAILLTLEVVEAAHSAPPRPAAPPGPAATARRAPAPPTVPAPASPPHAEPAAVVRRSPPAAPAAESSDAAPAEPLEKISAGPAVRRFAREVGVDLQRVRGSGPGGRVTRDDVLGVVRQASHAALQGADATPGVTIPGEPGSDSWGPVRFWKMTRIRRTIANKMQESWSSVPRVTNFDDADVSELEHIRQSSKADYAARGIKFTALPFVVKAVSLALRQHPELNASIDLEHEQVIFKEYVNIGIAVDSERGLVVPSLRGADRMSIPEIARQLTSIAEKVRTNSYSVDDLRGSTFTVSNLGAIGGTYSTPIVNAPEVAVLLVGRSRKLPVVVGDEVVVRLMMPLSISYDHRLVDGAAASRFLNAVIGYLEAPSRLLLAP